MSGTIEMVQPGIGSTVQDRGRVGHRHQGVPLSGWLDGPLAQAANALPGNPLDAAVLELRGMGTVLRVKAGPVRTALAGSICASCLHAEGQLTPRSQPGAVLHGAQACVQHVLRMLDAQGIVTTSGQPQQLRQALEAAGYWLAPLNALA
jgi:allophanate hydrolase subunit 2